MQFVHVLLRNYMLYKILKTNFGDYNIIYYTDISSSCQEDNGLCLSICRQKNRQLAKLPVTYWG